MKRVIAILLSLALFVSMTACGNNDSSSLLDQSVNDSLRKKYNVAPEYDFISNSVYKTFLACDSVIGDVNADGEFTVTDLVLFQKWLLASPDSKPENWRNADSNSDNRLDTFDLCLMRIKLTNNRNGGKNHDV